MIDKCLLHRVKLTLLGQSFHRDNLRAVSAGRRDHAAHHRNTIQKNSAGAAFSLSAAFFRPHQSGLFPQQTQQGFFLPGFKAVRPPIDGGDDRSAGAVRQPAR